MIAKLLVGNRNMINTTYIFTTIHKKSLILIYTLLLFSFDI